jgi:uncharacterized membrane protein YuzA (DUF378 family)
MDPKLRKRIQIGCLGALTPILINVLVVDLQTTLSNVTVISALAYLVRVIGLCAAACIVVYLNGDESRPIKLFQLGIMAPALLTGMLNGVAAANNQAASPGTATHSLIMPSFVGSAYAQAVTLPAGVTDCSKPDLTVGQQVLRGFAGIVPANEWFVVVGSSPTAESALADVAAVNSRFAGRFHASVCAPLGGSDNRYRVVIGKHLTYAAASKLKEEAAAAGFAGEPWVWNPVQASK